jgi:cyanophycin synthetase
MTLSGEPFTQFKSPDGDIWMTNDDKTYYPFPSIGAKVLSKSKIWSNDFFAQQGGNLPATYNVSKSTIDSLDFHSIINEHASLIVKPYDSTLSNGLTADIHTVDELRSAIDYAWESSEVALVQEQVFGQDIRFILLDGSVKGVLLRQTPRVTGDGNRTVEELIREENDQRSRLELPFGQHYKQLTKDNISEDYLTSQLVLDEGKTLELSREVLVRKGASIFNITSEVHPSYIATIENIAKELGKGLIAVDAFVRNYKEECDGTNYWFLEFNSSPALGLSYCTRDGNHFDILKYLIPMLDAAIRNRLS